MRRAKKKEKKTFRIITIILMLVIIISGSYFGVKVYKNGGGLQGILATIFGQTPESLKDLDTIYVLVLRN